MIRKSALIVVCFCILLVVSCNQRLPEQERKAYKDEMEQRKIRQITPQQIFDFTERRMSSLSDSVISGKYSEKDGLFSIEELELSDLKGEKMQQLMEAYLFNLETGDPLPDNRQELENGDILYSLPVVSDSAGIITLSRIVNVRFHRKEVIKTLSEENK